MAAKRILRIQEGRPEQSEKDVQNAIIELLLRRNIPYAQVNNTGAVFRRDGKTFFGKRKFPQPGVADIVCAYRGYPIAIEVKRLKNSRVSDEQKEWLGRWEKRGGGLWMIAYTAEDVNRVLDALD